jgi:hypothetical protein
MKKYLSHLVLGIICLITITTLHSCHKEGTGGKSGVSGTVYHHSKPIANAIVYIKYGATEFPGADVSVYDNKVTADANAHYEFTDLRKGDYFLYGVGYDDAIFQVVKGGLGIKLKYNKKATSDVPVTED